jgi:putative hemolysin
VGEIRDEYDTESPVCKFADGSWLIDAAISLRDLKEDHQIVIPESPEYETLAGFLITRLQKIPRVGDVVEIEGRRIFVKEMVGQRISKARMENLVKLSSEAQKEVKR